MTAKVVLDETLPMDAVIVEVPSETAVASPFVPEVLLIIENAGFDELQVTDSVRFCVDPLE